MSKHRYTAEIATIGRPAIWPHLSICMSHAQTIGSLPKVDRAYPVESNSFGLFAAKPAASENCFTIRQGLGSLANISKGFRFQGRNQPRVAT